MNVESIRKQFPILNQKVNGHNLVYLDNAATSQKPQVVIDAMNDYYTIYNSNVHRGLHALAAKADKAWIEAHQTVAKYLNAKSMEEVFFVRNATEGLNWVVNTTGRQRLKKDDVVIISEMEHHSNIVPWRMLNKEIPFILEVLPITETHELDFAHLKNLIEKYGDKIKVVSLVHKSNVLGVTIDVNKVKELIPSETILVLDGAQSIVHEKIDVQKLPCDVFIFSGHKVYGPTGSGAVYGRKELVDSLEPWMGGGDMIKEVKKDSIEWNSLPWKFEAGTPNIAGGIGLAAALKWFEKAVKQLGGWEKYHEYQNQLTKSLHEGLGEIKEIKLLSGPSSESLATFEVTHMHTHDVSSLLDERGIAIRAGYHCAQPLHEKLGSKGSVRASLGIYNTQEDVDAIVNAMKEIVKIF